MAGWPRAEDGRLTSSPWRRLMVEQELERVQQAPRQVLGRLPAPARVVAQVAGCRRALVVGREPAEERQVEFVDQRRVVTVAPDQAVDGPGLVAELGLDAGRVEDVEDLPDRRLDD